MTDSNILQDADIDVNALSEIADQSAEWLKNAQAGEAAEQQRLETQQVENEQALAAQEDPRNQEDWGIGGVVKELQSAFVGGVQDTASSIATLPERGLDIITGEMQEEMKSEEGYDAE